MFRSLFQIDFMADGGGSWRLLDFADVTLEEFPFPMEQQSSTYAPIGAEWAGGRGEGAARSSISWSRRVTHASIAACRSFCISHPATMPLRREGKLRVTIQGGATWDLLEATLQSASTAPYVWTGHPTMTNYRAECGRRVPVAGLPHTANSGFPHAWLLTAHQDQTLTHATL